MTVKLLAIETATEACSAAVYIDGEVIERYQLAPRMHNELILPMCEQVLSESGISVNQLDALAFGCGPGAFTGLRIAASVTQAIALAQDLPVASISTLSNLAHQTDMQEGEKVLTAIDARMDEIYWAVYEKNTQGKIELVGEEKVQVPETLEKLNDITYGQGTGWDTYHRELNTKLMLQDDFINGEALPRASITAQLGSVKYHDNNMVDAMHALPVYLRNQVVHKKI